MVITAKSNDGTLAIDTALINIADNRIVKGSDLHYRLPEETVNLSLDGHLPGIAITNGREHFTTSLKGEPIGKNNNVAIEIIKPFATDAIDKKLAIDHSLLTE